MNKMVIGSYIPVTTLKVNGLNVPTKRHRLAGWTQKQDQYMLSTRNHPQEKERQNGCLRRPYK